MRIGSLIWPAASSVTAKSANSRSAALLTANAKLAAAPARGGSDEPELVFAVMTDDIQAGA